MANDPSDSDPNQQHADAAATPKPPGAPEPPRGVEDAGAQALSEALRSSFDIVKFLMAALVLAFVFSGVFTVKPNQVAVKLRLRSEEHTSELQSLTNLVCRLLLEKKKKNTYVQTQYQQRL